MTEKKTISEAMAELKLIDKKVQKKIEFIKSNCVSYDHVADPYKPEGGRTQIIKQEEQAIKDLLERYESIREKIMEANLLNKVVISNITKSIYGWLIWRKEIKTKQTELYGMYTEVEGKIKQLVTQPQLVKKEDKDGNVAGELMKATSNIKLDEYRKELEKISDTFETLDGVLSLKNATIFIEV